jgi:hypothetical protein
MKLIMEIFKDSVDPKDYAFVLETLRTPWIFQVLNQMC